MSDAAASKAMTVAFVPFDSANPYQRQLAEHLRAFDVRVETERTLKQLVSGIVRGSGGPDVVHLHWLPRARLDLVGGLRAIAFLLRLFVVIATGRRIVWTVHNLYSHEAFNRNLERLVTLYVARMASQIIVHSETAVALVSSKLRVKDPKRIVVIPHGNYIGSYSNCVPRPLARKRLGLTDDSFVYLFFGNIRPYKGVKQLIATFQQMPEGSRVLLLAGKFADEALRIDIEQAIGGHPRIRVDAHFIRDDDVQVYMNACDVVVFPYLDVLTSGAVILAMSFARPCVAAKAGCIPDELDEQGAFLYEPGEIDGLRLSLENAHRNRVRLPAMGKHNLKRASQWDWSGVARETSQAYRRALGGSQSAAGQPFANDRMTDSAS